MVQPYSKEEKEYIKKLINKYKKKIKVKKKKECNQK